MTPKLSLSLSASLESQDGIDFLEIQRQKFTPHLISLKESVALFLDYLKKGDPFSYIRLTDSDVLGWLQTQGEYDKKDSQFIQHWISYTGLSDASRFPKEAFAKCVMEADLVGVQQPAISPAKWWLPTLECLTLANLLDQRQWIDLHTHCGLITYGHLFQYFIGKKIIWVGAKAPIFSEYFKNEPSYQKRFPQLHLNEFELIPIDTPEIGNNAYEATEIIRQQIRACYHLKPDFVLFSTGLAGRLLIPQVTKDGMTAIDMGAALDTLMNFPERRPFMEIFSDYQHPDIQINAPEDFWIETIRDKKTHQIIFDRNSPYPIKLWDFPTQKPLVDELAWQQKMQKQCDSFNQTKNLILSNLQLGKPFSFIRFTHSDVSGCIRHFRPVAEYSILNETIEKTGLINPDEFEVAALARLLSQGDFVGIYQPAAYEPQYWLPTLEALKRIDLWETRRWQPIETLHQLTASGELFEQFAGKHIVWVGAKAPIFKQYFHNHPAYQHQFPKLGLDAFQLTTVSTHEVGQSNIHGYFSTLVEQLQTEIYPQKPDIFLLSCGLLSRYLAPQIVQDGYTALDMGSILDALMGLTNRNQPVQQFQAFEHPDIIIHAPNKQSINSIFCRKTGRCLFSVHFTENKF